MRTARTMTVLPCSLLPGDGGGGLTRGGVTMSDRGEVHLPPPRTSYPPTLITPKPTLLVTPPTIRTCDLSHDAFDVTTPCVNRVSDTCL